MTVPCAPWFRPIGCRPSWNRRLARRLLSRRLRSPTTSDTTAGIFNAGSEIVHRSSPRRTIAAPDETMRRGSASISKVSPAMLSCEGDLPAGFRILRRLSSGFWRLRFGEGFRQLTLSAATALHNAWADCCVTFPRWAAIRRIAGMVYRRVGRDGAANRHLPSVVGASFSSRASVAVRMIRRHASRSRACRSSAAPGDTLRVHCRRVSTAEVFRPWV